MPGDPVRMDIPLTKGLAKSRIVSLEEGNLSGLGDKKQLKSILRQLKETLFNSWANILLVFVPAGIATHYTGVDPRIVFVLNFIAIIPLTGFLSYTTEDIALYCGEALGGLLNASFGNATEIIVCILALIRHEIVIVQTSLIGSILNNLLLVLSILFTTSSSKFPVKQNFSTTVAPYLAVGSLIVPTVFHLTSSASDVNITELARGIAIILFLVYSSYLAFLLKSYSHFFDDLPSKEPELEAPKTPAPASWFKVSLVIPATVLVALCGEGLVVSIDHVVTSASISRMFVGFTLLPIVGNAVEHARAVTTAVKDKVDLSILVAIGSSTQAILLAIPFIVVLGWCVGIDETMLYSKGLQAMIVLALVMLGNYLCQRLRTSESDPPLNAES